MAIAVFNLFGVKWKYDPNLSMDKINAFYSANPQY